ncbi:MAG: hypothetical protein ABJA80_11965 [bacterium]
MDTRHHHVSIPITLLVAGALACSSACLRLPSTAEFHVIDVAAHDTTTFTWTNADPVALGALGPSESPFQSQPDSPEFVAASSQGWSAALPGGATLAPADACTP